MYLGENEVSKPSGFSDVGVCLTIRHVYHKSHGRTQFAQLKKKHGYITCVYFCHQVLEWLPIIYTAAAQLFRQRGPAGLKLERGGRNLDYVVDLGCREGAVHQWIELLCDLYM